jgi:ABC-2 type transport system permease protein
MTSLRGTGALLRVAIRRDRIKLPAWIVGLVLLTWAQAAGIVGIYPGDEQRQAYAATTASSTAARLFGAVDGPALGSIMMNELFVFFSIVVALLCSMLVVRHTRQDEERGRLELARSAQVGRHAGLASAMSLATATCLVLAVTLGAALAATGLPVAGAMLMAASWGGVGLVFAAVAAVVAQLASSARLANGMCGLVLAAAFVARAFGDVGGVVSPDGMQVAIAWPSWLSPIGWGQLAYPFGARRWAVLGLYVVVAVVLACIAVALSARRDFGRGMLPERRANARGGRMLVGSLGLAVRLQRTAVLAWTAGLVMMGAIGGVFASAVDDMLGDNEQARELFAALGGTDVLVDAYYAIMLVYLGLLAAAMALQVTMRLRTEERGPGEALLVAGARRTSWLGSHVVVAVASAGLALLLSGIVMVAFAVAVDAPVDGGQLVAGALAQLSAVLVFVGLAVAGFGIAPSRAGWIGWGAYALAVVVVFLSAIDLPQWILDLSPFTHLPLVPAESIEAAPLLVLCGIGVAACAVGVAAFRRRDLRAGT